MQIGSQGPMEEERPGKGCPSHALGPVGKVLRVQTCPAIRQAGQGWRTGMGARLLPGVYLASEWLQPPPNRTELSHMGRDIFCPVSPGGGREGAVMLLGGRGTFHSSWAREVLLTEAGDQVDLESLFLAGRRKRL